MRITSWYVTLGIVGVSAIAVSACTATVNGGSGDGGTTDDSSTTSTEDSGTDTGTPGTDAATIIVTDASGDAGIVCEIPTGDTDTCDVCALQSCCQEEDTCQSEPLTDAGTTDCQEIFSCVQDCLVPPAGSGIDAGMTFADCTSLCAGHTPQGTADFNALSTCLSTSCATQCQ